MSCTAFLKYLYAYADGQLSEQAGRRVGEHLDACPECSRMVNEHQALRSTLSRDLQSIEVPADLAGRVRRAIAADKPEPGAHLLRRLWRARAIAVAASLALAVSLGWEHLPLGDAPHSTAETAVPQEGSDGGAVIRTPFGAGPLSAVVSKHDGCCDHHAMHQHQDLPRDLVALAPAISRHHGGFIKAIAPDLSDRGFEFESVNFCGVSTSDCGKGGHLLYVNGDGTERFSVFSVPRWDELDRSGGLGTAAGDVRRFVVEREDGTEVCLAVWHENTTHYICCGRIDAERMKSLTEDVRLALHHPGTAAIFAMLSWGP